MKKLFLLSSLIISIFSVNSLAHAEALLTGDKVRELSRQTTQTLDPSIKLWAKESLRNMSSTLERVGKYSDDKKDAHTYKKEFSNEIRTFITSLQNGSYTGSLSDSERENAEKTVLSYQKDMTEKVREWMKLLRENDIKESGFSHVFVSNKDATLKMSLENYRVTQTRDMEKIEIDGTVRISMTGSQFGGDTSISIEGNVLLVKNDLYISLRKYSFTGSSSNFILSDIDKTLKKIAGKTVHKKLDEYMTTSLTDSKKYRETFEKVLSILESESLLTPIARGNDGIVMILKKSTLKKLLEAIEAKTVRLHDAKLILPIQIRLDGTTLKLLEHESSHILHASLSRDATGKAGFEALVSERGTSEKWQWKIVGNSDFFALAGAGKSYSISAEAKTTGAKAEVKKGNTVIATAKIEKTGFYAWTYDLSATWENMFGFLADDASAKDTILLRIWGSIRDEFGNFTLTPPSIYEELDTVLE